MDVYAGKARGQRSTFGLLARLGWGLGRRRQFFEFFFNGRDVGINRLFDQADLRPIELFT